MSYNLYFPQRRPSSAPMVASHGLPHMSLPSLVDSSPSPLSDRLYSPTQYRESPPLTMTDPSVQWLGVHANPNYYQEACNYRHSQETYDRQYEYSVAFPAQGSVVDESTWAYSYPSDFSRASSTLTCPRSYPPGLTVDSIDSMGSTMEAYPPAAYHLDLQAHQPYLNLSSTRLFPNGSPSEQSCGTVGQISDGGSFRENSYHRQSPTPSHSSTPSYRINKDPTLSPPPVEGYEGIEMARLKDEETDEECGLNDEPYAKLIYRALMSVPERRMVLRDIYEWFELNTDKAKNACSKGWQNSIRHNLSMNGAFKKVNQLPPCDESKKGFIWVLEPSAIQGGVKSTTRYRKIIPNKKSCRSENPAPLRQRSGAKGGKAARKAAKMRRSARNEELEGIQMADRVAGGMMTIARSSLHDHTRPATPLVPSDQATSYSSYDNSVLDSSQQLTNEPINYSFEDIVGCVDTCPNEPLFYENSDDHQGSIAREYQITNLASDSIFCPPVL